MPTGDGLLARLNPADGRLSARQLAGVARAAEACGNGVLEITTRGSLQIRGLNAESAEDFAEAVAALGIEAAEGPEVRTGALAGHDPLELADPRPLAAAIRKAAALFSARLAPKISVIVDGGGQLPLDSLSTDIRLTAIGTGNWALGLGGTAPGVRWLGAADSEKAVARAVELLTELARRGPLARGRDLDVDSAGLQPVILLERKSADPVGSFRLRNGFFARGLSPAFGRIEAAELASLADSIRPDGEFRLAPGHGLLALALTPQEDEKLLALAERLGLVTSPDDPRLRIVACAGAPACAAGLLETRRIAQAVDAGLVPEGGRLYIAGCPKACARPAGPSVSLVATPAGLTIAGEGVAVPPRLRARLTDLALEGAPLCPGRPA
jgi:precorrin-3B synthase